VIACEGTCCRINGAVTVDSVGGLLRELQPQLANGIDVLDFSAVEVADSAPIGWTSSQSGVAAHCSEHASHGQAFIAS